MNEYTRLANILILIIHDRIYYKYLKFQHFYFQPYDLPMAAKTGAASVSAGLWRIFITPIDTVKTTLQVTILLIWRKFLCSKSLKFIIRPQIYTCIRNHLVVNIKHRLKGNKHYHSLPRRSGHMDHWYDNNQYSICGIKCYYIYISVKFIKALIAFNHSHRLLFMVLSQLHQLQRLGIFLGFLRSTHYRYSTITLIDPSETRS